jgi:TetR/AcrR family transcriptional repressor of nem operon
MPWQKQFDRTDAVQPAQRVFWKTGYEKSSLSVLLKGMGIQKGSFYATFKSKHKVLVEALQLYIQQRFDSFLALKANQPPIAAMRRHLDEVLRESIGPDRFMGCFLVWSSQDSVDSPSARFLCCLELLWTHSA